MDGGAAPESAEPPAAPEGEGEAPEAPAKEASFTFVR